MEQLLIETPSLYPFDRTVERIIAEAGNRNWRMPAIHDLQQTLAKAGKSVLPVKVIELCKPEYAGKILELNHERAVSVMMPCRISVYEKEDGKTYVALMNAAAMAGSLSETVAGTMIAAADDLLEMVLAAITEG